MLRNAIISVFPLICLGLNACDARVIDSTHEKGQTVNIYQDQWTTLTSEPFSSESLNGSVTLVVNVASECGYTKQYRELQELNDAFENFQVIGFPCNDFGGQEPCGADTIQACAASFDATFPLMAKVNITDEQTRSSLYQSMHEATGVLPEWNFGKYLINKEGMPVAFFGSTITPMSDEITQRIDALLVHDAPPQSNVE